VYLKLYTLNKDFDKDPKVGRFLERHALAFDHYGRFVKLISKGAGGAGTADDSNGDSGSTTTTLETENKIIWAFEQLEWNHLANHVERSIHVKFPKSYKLF